MAKNNDTKSQSPVTGKPIVTIVLIVLLVGAAFAIGSLWTKVQTYEDGGGSGTQNAKNPSPTQQPSDNKLSASNLPNIAKQIDVDVDDFTACLDGGDTKSMVQDDYQAGVDSGIRGTPGNILLDTQTGATLLVSGAVPIDNLKASVDSLLNETATSENIDISLNDGDFLRGESDARIILFEYSDLECPFCARFHPTAQQAVDDYDGQVAWVYRHFPLDQIHPDARTAAEGAECVGKIAGSEKFWEYIDYIYQ